MKKFLITLLAGLAFSLNAFATVNINAATQEELESLVGIGPVKAQAIIDYRKKNGSFKSVDELEKVDGIGAKTLESVRKDVTLAGRTAAPAADTKEAEKPVKAEKASKKEEKAAKVEEKAAKKEQKSEAKAAKDEDKAAKVDEKAADKKAKAEEKAAKKAKSEEEKKAKAEAKAAKADKKKAKAEDKKAEVAKATDKK